MPPGGTPGAGISLKTPCRGRARIRQQWKARGVLLASWGEGSESRVRGDRKWGSMTKRQGLLLALVLAAEHLLANRFYRE